MNSNPVPPVDVILCRDTISFLSAADQGKLLADFSEKAKHGGAVVLGAHERMPEDTWTETPGGVVSVFTKKA
ncbi:hypothetical protein MASR2M48_14480 [Spirochaetota bacterium]